jgi:hypothetical protein
MKLKALGIVVLLCIGGTLLATMTNSVGRWRFNDERLLKRHGDLHNWAVAIESGYGEAAVIATRGDYELSASQTGAVIFADGNDEGTAAGNQIHSLPAAAAGLKFTFIDANSTADEDLYIKAASGDKINQGTAGEYLACKTDSAGQSVTLAAMNEERWEIVAVSGTWDADDAPD